MTTARKGNSVTVRYDTPIVQGDTVEAVDSASTDSPDDPVNPPSDPGSAYALVP